MPVPLNSYNLAAAEKALCVAALEQGGSIVEAARMLGITRHALKRRIVKHAIDWPRTGTTLGAPTTEEAAAAQAHDRHSEPAAPAPPHGRRARHHRFQAAEPGSWQSGTVALAMQKSV